MKIAPDVLEILSHSTVNGNLLYLPPTQLDRKLYLDVNKCLESIGGKWNKKSKSHVFDIYGIDPSDLLDDMINTGEYTNKKKEFNFFETPKEIVSRMIELAEIKPSNILLEPEAGKGAILSQFPKENKSYGVELWVDNFSYLKEHFPNATLFHADFLNPKLYLQKDFPTEVTKVIMNPPFFHQNDVKHIFQAWDLISKGGILVSIVSESPFFRENKISLDFRNWLKENNTYSEILEDGAFKESGTMVKTRIIRVRKS